MGQEQLHLGPRNLFQQGSVPQDCPTPAPFLHAPSSSGESSCHLCCWLTDMNWGSLSPLLSFDSFAREAHRTWENSSFTKLPVYYINKGCNSKTARWKRCIRQSVWEGAPCVRAHSGSVTLSHPSCWPTWRLSESHCLGVLWRPFHSHYWLNHCWLVTDSTSNPSPLPKGQGNKTQSSNPLFMAGTPGNQPPSWEALQK